MGVDDKGLGFPALVRVEEGVRRCSAKCVSSETNPTHFAPKDSLLPGILRKIAGVRSRGWTRGGAWLFAPSPARADDLHPGNVWGPAQHGLEVGLDVGHGCLIHAYALEGRIGRDAVCVLDHERDCVLVAARHSCLRVGPQPEA